MFLTTLILTHFKNHENKSFQFGHKVNFFYGKNGVGKTNILDAIYYLATFKSFIQLRDSKLPYETDEYFRIESHWMSEYKVVAKYAENKKTIEINDEKIGRPSRKFGHIPLVLASPQDLFLLHGTSTERRKFIDFTISQVNPTYLNHIITYQKLLDQRNKALKGEKIDSKLLDVYDESMDELANDIFNMRKHFMTEFIAFAQKWYHEITKLDEDITMSFISHLHEADYLTLAKKNREKDIVLRRTNKGIHRDDILIEKEGEEAKKMASQGQQKTLLYALRLAQAEYISNKLNQEVIFLFDDISDKLDAYRIQNLIQTIPTISFVSQWFITDTKGSILDCVDDKEVFEIE